MSDHRENNSTPDADEDNMKSLLSALSKMRIDGLFCDVVISVHGVDFLAHRNILAANSTFFKLKLVHLVCISR
jgi:BTB/POZ domain